MKRTITFLLILTFIAAILTIGVGASDYTSAEQNIGGMNESAKKSASAVEAEGAEASGWITNIEGEQVSNNTASSYNVTSSDNAQNADNAQASGGVTSTEDEQAPENTTEGKKNAGIIDEIYSIILKNSDKILALLSFAASLAVAFAYKKGLLPIIKGGLGTVADTVAKLKAETEKAAGVSNERLLEAAEKLGKAEELTRELSSRAEDIAQVLTERAEEKETLSQISTVLASQIDMLYEIFMSSSLPLYQKEAVGERISEMKRTIAQEKRGE